MVGELRDMDVITSEPVAAAVANVPRHLFALGEPLEAAYAYIPKAAGTAEPFGGLVAKRHGAVVVSWS